MRKLIVFFVFSLFMITTVTFGEQVVGEQVVGEQAFGEQGLGKPVNLVGTWTVRMQVASVDGSGYNIEDNVLQITDQRGSLFRGHAIPEDPPKTNFYGAIVGRDIYITFWDSVCSGTVNKRGTQFSFVAQNQQYDPPHSPATAIGIAIRH